VPLTAQDVAEIMRLLEESDFEELRIEHEGMKVTLRRGTAARREGTDIAAAAGAAAAGAGVAPTAAAAVPAQLEPHGEPKASTSDRTLLDVTAPLLGIFYRAARPGAAPYVQVGSEVQEDTIIGIIEVMKLMNSVRAEVRGTVAEILVQDGATVEDGQVLLRVRRGGHGG